MDSREDPEAGKDTDEVAKLEGKPLQKENKETEIKKASKAKGESTIEKPAFSHTINAPLVGTFYSSAGPGKPPLVKIGDSVKKGDKVCMVEAMKLFNEIQALEDCKILEFLVKDGESVKKDQALVGYEPV